MKHQFKVTTLLAGSLLTAFTIGSTPACAQFSGPVPVNLVNGWTALQGLGIPEFEEVNGVVRFRGTIRAGSTAFAFTLPAGSTPAADVYLPLTLCNGTNGRLLITSAGVADVEAENGTF